MQANLDKEWRVNESFSRHVQEAGSPYGHVIAAIQKLDSAPPPGAEWVEDGPSRPCSSAMRLSFLDFFKVFSSFYGDFAYFYFFAVFCSFLVFLGFFGFWQFNDPGAIPFLLTTLVYKLLTFNKSLEVVPRHQSYHQPMH